MGPAPLPPHERSWRHPSELAADERELVRLSEAPSSTRAFAMVTGTVGLLAVAALMLTLTPRREPSPTALDSTTLPGVQVASLAAGTSLAVGPTRSIAVVTMRLATPIGDGKQALMTTAGDDAATGTELDVQLTSGPVVTAVVARTNGDMVVVSIDADGAGHTIASGLPSPDEIVTVLLDPPVTIAFSDVDQVEADEGTPVLDDDGELVGLCTHRDGALTSLIDVTGGDATSTTAPPVDSTVEPSTTPSSEVPDSTITASSAPASSAAATTAAP